MGRIVKEEPQRCGDVRQQQQSWCPKPTTANVCYCFCLTAPCSLSFLLHPVIHRLLVLYAVAVVLLLWRLRSAGNSVGRTVASGSVPTVPEPDLNGRSRTAGMVALRFKVTKRWSFCTQYCEPATPPVHTTFSGFAYINACVSCSIDSSTSPKDEIFLWASLRATSSIRPSFRETRQRAASCKAWHCVACTKQGFSSLQRCSVRPLSSA